MVIKCSKILGIGLLLSVLLCGCAKNKKVYTYTEPEESITIEMYDWQSEEAEEDNCLAFVYDGREYLYYADVEGTLLEEDVRQCAGCFSYDGQLREDEVLLTLTYNDSNDYLVIYYTESTLMAQSNELYRAADTKGENVETPDFAKEPQEGNPMYQFWINEAQ